MIVPRPHLSSEVTGLAWDIALAANRAFDTLREAEANITEVQRVALTVEGDELTYEALGPLEKIRNDAQADYQLLTEMVAPIMSRPANPFSRTSHETRAVGPSEVARETTEQSETLPAAFRECLIARYAQKSDAVARQIKDGTLPESYNLPDVGALLVRAIPLALTFEIMAKKNWRPEVVFVPRRLGLEQWNALLTGHRLADRSWTEGVHRTWAGFEIDQPIVSAPESSPWEIVVMSAAERPVLASVSKDGRHGFNAASAVRALSDLPTVREASSPEDAVRLASPTEERYLALQLARLERGEMPVDSGTWTIGNEDLDIGGELGSLYFFYRPKEHRFKSIWRSREAFDNNDGVRPTAGEDGSSPAVPV